MLCSNQKPPRRNAGLSSYFWFLGQNFRLPPQALVQIRKHLTFSTPSEMRRGLLFRPAVIPHSHWIYGNNDRKAHWTWQRSARGQSIQISMCLSWLSWLLLSLDVSQNVVYEFISKLAIPHKHTSHVKCCLWISFSSSETQHPYQGACVSKTTCRTFRQNPASMFLFGFDPFLLFSLNVSCYFDHFANPE